MKWRDRELQLQIILGAIVEYGTVIFLAYKLLQLIDWLLNWFCESVPTPIQAVAIAAGVGLLLALIIHIICSSDSVEVKDSYDDSYDFYDYDDYDFYCRYYDNEKTTEEWESLSGK